MSADNSFTCPEMKNGSSLEQEVGGGGKAPSAYLVAMGPFVWTCLRSLSSSGQKHFGHVPHWSNRSFQEWMVCWEPGSASND